MSKENQILKLRAKGYSQRRIADTLKVSRNTVAKVFNALETHPVSETDLTSITDQELHARLFPEDSRLPVLVTPDYDYLHKEMLKSSVTLKLLWEDYVDSCRRSGKPPYMYSQFCKLYQDYVNQNHLTMHIRHKPGDKLMVDWVGTPLPLYDKVTAAKFICLLPPCHSVCTAIQRPALQ